jgi:hypothetical protein
MSTFNSLYFYSLAAGGRLGDLERLTQRVDQLEGVVRGLYPVVQQLRADMAAVLAERTGARHPDAASVAAPAVEPQASTLTTRVDVSAGARPAAPTSAASVASAVRIQAGASSSAAARQPGVTSAPEVNLEAFVGRYGALALATVSILLAVGAFVRWAVARGLLGPTVRVALGLIAAAAVAVVGMWLRSHGARKFGHTMLALALAIVHVDAWGAGPILHLVSAPAALAAAAIASAALAWLALLDGEPTIFSVGAGGALLAPFVTSTGDPHLAALLTFGYAVIAISVWAVRDRGWAVPVAILALGSVVYANVGAQIRQPDWSAPAAFLPSAFALACAGTALFVLPPRYRSTLAQGALAALVGTLSALTAHGSVVSGIVVAAAVGSVAAYATVPVLGDAILRTGAGACVLPLALLANAVWAVPPLPIDRALTIAGWAVGAAVAATVYSRRLARDTGAAASDPALPAGRYFAIAMAGLNGGAAIVVGFGERHPVLATVLLAAYSATLAVAAAQREWPSALLPVFAGLGVAALWSWALLAQRVSYAYTPFLTRQSAAAAVVVAAWGIAAAMLARAHWLQPIDRPGVASSDAAMLLRALQLMPVALLFLWIRQELTGAVSSEVSTFLLIAYYATAGVAAVFAGRVRSIGPLRHVGLAIAVYAALKAVAEAAQLGVGLRIASYLSAGLFLLAVAYWYRGEETGHKKTG